MSQDISVEWTKKKLFIFRLFTVYFILYFIFIGQSFGDYYQIFFNAYQYLGKYPYQITEAFIRLINYLFFHKQLSEGFDFAGDTFWGYIASLSFFILALLATLLWTKIDKRKCQPVLFIYLHTIVRYYLAFTLLAYGIGKLFGNQFFIPPWGLITPLSDLIPQHVLWSFVAASKSYHFFGGLIEVIPGVLLLFRRTSTLSALLAIPVLINVLMLNVGYDVSLKLVLFHLIIFAVYILAPNIKKLYYLFLLNQKASLAKV